MQCTSVTVKILKGRCQLISIATTLMVQFEYDRCGTSDDISFSSQIEKLAGVTAPLEL